MKARIKKDIGFLMRTGSGRQRDFVCNVSRGACLGIRRDDALPAKKEAALWNGTIARLSQVYS